MASVNRFIQFNNETIDTKLLHQMELLAAALADAPYLKVTTRKLIELRPSELAISMSVFWRHRTKRIERNGYLSDIYLMAAGFWREFDLTAWRDFKKSKTTLPSLREQLLLCAEEFRLSEKIKAARPGTVSAFQTREVVYTEYHEDQSKQNLKKGFKSDLFINAAYLRLRGVEVDVGELTGALSLIWTELFDAKSTMDSVKIVNRIMDRAEFELESDALHTYYTFGESLEKIPPFHYHEGIEADEAEEPEEIETIEEWFGAWHRETEISEAPAMEFELESGDSQIADGGREEAGASEVEQTAKGDSSGDHLEDSDKDDHQMKSEPKKAEGKFGSANDQVVYHESRLKAAGDHRLDIENWRRKQAPHVRALLKELKNE